MQKTKGLHKSCFSVLSTLFLGLMAVGAHAADYYPPRVSYMDGTAAYEPAGDVDWDEVTLNLPLLSGDRIFSQMASRLEIELGNSNFVRLGSETDLVFSQIDRERLVLELHTGELILRLNRDQRIEIYTPHGRIEIKRDGLYRISSDPQNETRLVVRKGRAYLEGPSGEVRVDEGQQLLIGGQTGDYQQVSYGGYSDEFDLWSDRRDARFVRSQSVTHVGGSYYPGIYDLDYYGNWAYYPSYGRVWVPRVSVGWAPFRFGSWGYLSFGWTWISNEPWGWLPYHYGNWIYHRSRWCWVPGGFNSWSPAVVNFYFGNGWVGWAPRGYYGRNRYINNNTVIVNNSRTVINNWNGNGPGNGLTVVSRDDFARGRTRVDRVSFTPTREMVRNLRPGLPQELSRPRINRAASAGRNESGRVRENRGSLPTSGVRTRSVRAGTAGETANRVRGSAMTPDESSRTSTIRTRPGSPTSSSRREEGSTNRYRSPTNREDTGIAPRTGGASSRRSEPPQAVERNRGAVRTVPSPTRAQPERDNRRTSPSTIRTAPRPPRIDSRTVRPGNSSRTPRPSVNMPRPRTTVPRSINRPAPSRSVPSVRSAPSRSSPRPSVRSAPRRNSSRPSVTRSSPSRRSMPTIRSRPSPGPSVTGPSRTSRPSTSSRPAPRRRPD